LRNDDQVLVVGVTEHGGHAFEVLLDHGADPDVLAFDQGYVVLRPVDASRAGSGELILRLLVPTWLTFGRSGVEVVLG
jgi:hypothetical protein